MASKSLVRIKLNPKVHLSPYHANLPMKERRKILCQKVKEMGFVPVIRRLNAVYVLQKNKNPKVAIVFRDDKNFLMGLRDGVIKKSKSLQKTRKVKTI